MIFITGATGFVGSHLLKALQKEGIEARCLVRNKEKARIVESLGFEAVIGDITDRGSLRGKIRGARVVVHLVGIIQETQDITFDQVHLEGTENLIEEALSAGVREIFYQSALGADINSRHKYLQTKGHAEELVKLSGMDYWIFKPSLIIGPGDGFTENIKKVLSLGPVVTVPGTGNTKFQPLSVDDWTRAFLIALKDGDRQIKTYEFGGPEHITYNEMLRIMMKEMGINKPIVHLPIGLVKAGIPLATLLGRFTTKIPRVTPEQLDLLQIDNITDIHSMERLFGFTPEPFRAAIKKAL